MARAIRQRWRHATAEFMGVAVEALAGDSPPARKQVEGRAGGNPLARPARAGGPPGVSGACSPTRSRGLSRVIGSWNTSPTRLAPQPPQRLALQQAGILTGEQQATAAGASAGSSCSTARATVALAERERTTKASGRGLQVRYEAISTAGPAGQPPRQTPQLR